MRKLLSVIAGVLCLPLFLIAQDEADNSYVMVESEYILPKIGQEDAFEAAIKAHNDKYHANDPYAAVLYYVQTGNEAGWYVWEMGPTTYTALDSRPGKDSGHDADWSDNVAPHVQQYGRTEYWRRNKDESYSTDKPWDKLTLWWVDITRGEYYRFHAMMEKIRKVHETQDDDISVWYTDFNQNDGRDVAIVWPFAKWAEFDSDDWQIRKEYDAEYGEGEWQNALEEWEEIVQSVSREVWVKR